MLEHMKETAGTRAPMLVQGQNREDVRQHNLSIVLRMLHLRGSVSRSELTAVTGLNRSTISDLVSELEELKLAHETDGAVASGVGRPSHMVSAVENVVAISVHTEYDATTVGVVSLSGKVLSKKRLLSSGKPTPENSVKLAAKEIARLRSEMKSDVRIAGVGIAVPGQVRVSDGVVRLAPHLGWVEVPLGPMMIQATGLPVFLDNDASLGCMAERNFGSARELSDVVFLYAGSGGIGGGAIVDGHQLRGAAGYAGELGHVRISAGNAKDYSGLSGTLESLVRRDDLLDIFKFDSAADEELDAEIGSTKSAKAIKLLNEQIDALGLGLSNFVNIFNPQVVVLAGFLTSLFRFDEERLINRMREGALGAAHERVVIRSAELGSDLLMFGAAELPFGDLISRPSNAKLTTPKGKGAK
ncbi:MAG: ROK family protein [Actinobacteria bacterium]|nr:ROK family protein [Actinomycetota bacterium]